MIGPSSIAHLRSRLTDNGPAEYLALGPDGQAVYAVRARVGPTSRRITLVLLPPEAGELHVIMGVRTFSNVSSEPNLIDPAPLAMKLERAVVREFDLFVEGSLMEMFRPAPFVKVHWGSFSQLCPIELTFSTFNDHDVSEDLLVFVQRVATSCEQHVP